MGFIEWAQQRHENREVARAKRDIASFAFAITKGLPLQDGDTLVRPVVLNVGNPTTCMNIFTTFADGIEEKNMIEVFVTYRADETSSDTVVVDELTLIRTSRGWDAEQFSYAEKKTYLHTTDLGEAFYTALEDEIPTGLPDKQDLDDDQYLTLAKSRHDLRRIAEAQDQDLFHNLDDPAIQAEYDQIEALKEEKRRTGEAELKRERARFFFGLMRQASVSI